MIRIDWRAALLTAGAMTWMLVVHPGDWVARWGGLSSYVRVSLLILCPVLVAAGAWQAGRDRRARLEEILASTPRPPWQPLFMGWAGITLGGLAGMLPPLAVAAVLVGVRSTYVGTGWWWTLLVGLVALITASALGLMIGRLAPLRVIAPVAGLMVYLGLAVPIYLYETPWTRLSPVIGYARAVDVWPVTFHAWQAGWLLTLAAVLFLLAARQWWAAAVPAMVAAIFVMVPARAGADFGEPSVDAGATALVCTERVCLTRVNAFLLTDVAVVLEPRLDRLAAVPGAPTRAVDELARRDGEIRPDVVWIPLNQQAEVTGGVAREDWLLSSLSSPFHDVGCPPEDDIPPALLAADEWARGLPPPRLAALGEAEQRAWVGRVLAAARACDQPELIRLELR